MQQFGIANRVNNSYVRVHDDNTDVALYPVAATYTDSQVGDLVDFNTSGQVVRAPSNNTSSSVYRGVVVGIPVNEEAYPSQGGHYANAVLVSVIEPSKTELFVREINDTGDYVAPSLAVNSAVRFIYNSTTKRWGVQAGGGTNPTHGYIVRRVERSGTDAQGGYDGYIIRLV